MAGTCEKCGKEILRPYPADAAVCKCESTTLVDLTLVMVVPKNIYRKYRKIAEIAQVDTEQLINKVLEVGLKERLKEIRIKHA